MYSRSHRGVAVRLLLAVILAAPGVPAAGAASTDDPLVAAVRAGAAAVGQPPAFERTTMVTRGGATQTRVERFDPRAPEGQRWVLVAIDGAPPPARERDQFAQAMREARPPGYWRMALLLADGASRVPGDGEAILRVAPLPAAALDGQARAFADRLVAEMRLTPGERPQVREARVFAPAPMRRGPARLGSFETVSRFAPGPGGTPRLEAQTSRMVISLLGREMTITTRSTYRYL